MTPLEQNAKGGAAHAAQGEPFALLGEAMRVDVVNENEGHGDIRDLTVYVSWLDSEGGIILWGNEIAELHTALGEIVAGRVDFSGDGNEPS
ncbi:hypothetical protein ACQKJZ_04410 [Sphingomonas sp. NPDC019816]|uniref:hypothetical protein n=1 Tax=Sphingomonas sp. NPDC019816 TaxID=3390679 RepID=UPI003CFEFF3F